MDTITATIDPLSDEHFERHRDGIPHWHTNVVRNGNGSIHEHPYDPHPRPDSDEYDYSESERGDGYDCTDG